VIQKGTFYPPHDSKTDGYLLAYEFLPRSLREGRASFLLTFLSPPSQHLEVTWARLFIEKAGHSN